MKSLKAISICLPVLIFSFQHALADMTPPKPVQDYLKNAIIGEDNSLPSMQGALWVFQDYLKKNWKDVLNNIQTIAPTDNEKCKIVLGCEALPDDEYLGFLQKIEQLFAQHRIDMTVVETALAPSEARSGFLADNWKNPAVKSLMEQFRILIPAGHYLKSYPDKVLSGKAKAEKDDWDRMSNEKSPATPQGSPSQ
jgi:hypothetical protein